MKQFLDSPQSTRRLLLIFAVTLLLFVGIRFDSDALIRSKVQALAASANIQFSYQQLHISPLSLRATNISIVSRQIPKGLMLEEIAISPLWSSLFTDDLAADVEVIWQGNRGSARVKRSDQNILLEEIKATVDVADLIPFIKSPISLNASGVSTIEGELLINPRVKAPLAGRIDASSEAIAINVMGLEFPVGNILVHLEEKSSPSWQWKATAGKNSYMNASGTLEMIGGPRQWKADGLLSLNASNIENQMLNNFIKSIVPNGDLLQARIFGTLNRPQMKLLP